MLIWRAQAEGINTRVKNVDKKCPYQLIPDSSNQLRCMFKGKLFTPAPPPPYRYHPSEEDVHFFRPSYVAPVPTLSRNFWNWCNATLRIRFPILPFPSSAREFELFNVENWDLRSATLLLLDFCLSSDSWSRRWKFFEGFEFWPWGANFPSSIVFILDLEELWSGITFIRYAHQKIQQPEIFVLWRTFSSSFSLSVLKNGELIVIWSLFLAIQFSRS